MKKIVVIGGGGHAKVVIDSILSAGEYAIEGILDPQKKIGERVLGVPVLGPDEWLERSGQSKNNLVLALGMGSVRSSDKRKKIYEIYERKGYEFPAIIHKKACITKDVTYGNGLQAMPGVIVRPGAKLAKNIVLYSAAVIEHDCTIDSHCYIAPAAVMGAGAEIGENTFVGMNAVILQEIKIGKNVTIGAGAVVTKDVADGKTVAGVPAREIHA